MSKTIEFESDELNQIHDFLVDADLVDPAAETRSKLF